jgi:uncharacterized protein YbaR (Trm112 family)
MPSHPVLPDFASTFELLRRELACPACFGALQFAEGHLVCVQCQSRYPIADGIPVLIAGAVPKSD